MLVVRFPVGQKGCRRSKERRKKVVGQPECAHTGAPRQRSQIAQRTARPNAAQKIVGNVVGIGGRLRRRLDEVHLVIEMVVKVAPDGTRVHGAHVNAERLRFNVHAGGQLTDKGFRAGVHGRKRSGNKACHAAGKDNATPSTLCNEGADKVVCDLQGRRGVALQVGEQLFDRRLVEKTRYHEAGIAKDNGNVEIFCAFDNFVHVVDAGCEIDPNLTKLLLGMRFANFGERFFEKFVVERNQNHVQSLTSQFECERLANP